jgi:hypothetical protein
LKFNGELSKFNGEFLKFSGELSKFNGELLKFSGESLKFVDGYPCADRLADPRIRKLSRIERIF